MKLLGFTMRYACSTFLEVSCWAVSPTSFIASFWSDLHKVLWWLVGCTVICVWFSIQMVVICFIWLQLISVLTVHVCHYSLLRKFRSWSTSFPLSFCVLACKENMSSTLWVFAQDLNCDILTGWSAGVIGSLEVNGTLYCPLLFALLNM